MLLTVKLVVFCVAFIATVLQCKAILLNFILTKYLIQNTISVNKITVIIILLSTVSFIISII